MASRYAAYRASPDGVAARQRAEAKPERKAWRAAWCHAKTLRTVYGITVGQYEQMLTDQDHRCAICGSARPGHKKTRFAVDHCHLTGRVRGLLCHACNMGIGCLSESAKVLRAAAAYLELKR